MTGFAETFAQSILEIAPGGGSDRPEPEATVQGVLFVVDGGVTVTLDGADHALSPGGYAYLPPGRGLAVRNETQDAPRGSTGSARPTSRSTASTCPIRS